MNRSLTGIILAGGRSSRLGQEKGLAILNNKPLIEYTIDCLLPLCDEILISTNSTDYLHYGFKAIADIFPGKGPVCGVHACLAASKNMHNIVISVDTPFINQELIHFILANKGNNLAAAPIRKEGFYEPLCAYYHKNTHIQIESMIHNGIYKLQKLFEAIPFTPVKITGSETFYHPMLFHNINTPKDLELAEAYLKSTNE